MKTKLLLAAAFAALLSLSAYAQDEAPSPKPKAFRVSLTFNKFDKEKDLYKQVWPFAAPAKDAIPTKASEAVFAGEVVNMVGLEKYGSMPFEVFSTKGISRSSKNGFIFGGKAGDYITIPAVEGKILSRVSIMTGEGGLVAKPSITTMEGTVLKGGKAKEEIKDKEGNVLDIAAEGARTSYGIKGAETGKVYKFALTADETIAIRRLTFYYKDVETE